MHSSILGFGCGFVVLTLPLPKRMLASLMPALEKRIPAVLATPLKFSGITFLLEHIRVHASTFRSVFRSGSPSVTFPVQHLQSLSTCGTQQGLPKQKVV